jgi:putative hemolysin
MSLLSITAIVLAFFFSALFSGVETGSYMINRIRLRRRKQQRQRSAIDLSRLLHYPYIFIFTVLIGNNIAVFLVSKEVTDLYLNGGMNAGQMLLGFIPWNAEMAATLTLMFPLFLFAEVGPKNLFRKKSDPLMYRLAWLMQILVVVFLPITWPLRQLFRLLSHNSESESLRNLHRLSPDALREYFSEGEKDGIISPDQNRMLDNVTSMHSVPIRQLMTPLREIPCLPQTATVGDLKQLLARRNSAYAILMNRHAVVGLVSIFPIINRKLADDAVLKPYAEDVLMLDDGRNIKSAFYRLRRNPRHSAVVVDTRKHPVGVVHLEDIARYIARK